MPQEPGEKQAQTPLSEDTARVLQWIADTPGKEFNGDVNKVVQWMLFIAKRNEPWMRFTLDLFVDYERARIANEQVASQA